MASKPVRKEKPEKQQESASSPSLKERSRAKPGFMDKLFGSSKNLPAAVKTPPAPQVDPIRLAETIVTKRNQPMRARPEVTTPSRLQKQNKNEASAVRSKNPKGSSRQSNKTRLALFALLIGLIGYGMNEWRQVKIQEKELAAAEEETLREAEQALRDRVLFHRNLTGGKLNRDRVGIEVENQVTAPSLPTLAKPVRPPDVMAGLPLVAEPHHRAKASERIEPLSPNFADTNVMHSLREQQAANDWEEQAREQYIKEFIANAARAGYQVKVDSNGVVTVMGRNGAIEAGKLPPMPSSPGVAR